MEFQEYGDHIRQMRKGETAARRKNSTAYADAVTDGTTNEANARFATDARMSYTMVRRVFDEVYYAVDELAGKYPNEVIAPFKVGNS